MCHFSYFIFSVTLIWWNDYLLRRLGSTRTPSPSKSVWVEQSLKRSYLRPIKVLQQGRVRVQQSGKEFSSYLNGGLFDLVCDQVSGVMRQLGQNPSEAEIQDMVNQVRGGNGHGGYLTVDVDLLFSFYDP